MEHFIFQAKWAFVNLTKTDFWPTTFSLGDLTLMFTLTDQNNTFEVNLPIIPLWASGLHHGVLCRMELLLDEAKTEDEIRKLT